MTEPESPHTRTRTPVRSEPPLATRLRMTLLRTSRRLRAESAGVLTEGQLSVLSHLFIRGPLTAGELADLEHVRPPSMTRTTQGLEAAGYVQRAAHPTDGRQVVFSVTDDGDAYIRETRRRRDQWLQRRLAALTVAERATLSEAEAILREVCS